MRPFEKSIFKLGIGYLVVEVEHGEYQYEIPPQVPQYYALFLVYFYKQGATNCVAIVQNTPS